MKKLVISEKPSVAADIARVLGRAKKCDDYYENDEYVIASALGHLVELNMPADIDKKYARWSLSNLPIIPEKFKLKPIEKTKAKLAALKKLLSRKDIDGVINACDAGREGELIFTYIYEITKCKLPRQRLWVSSMTPSSILEAFSNLKSQEEMESLQDAARCRSESDWLVGINGTRAITSRMYGSRGKSLASVGRVQTPTLAMIVEREHEIQNFKPTRYWKITAEFEIENGKYEGVYQRPDFKQKDKDANDKADRIWSHADAERVLNEVRAEGRAKVSDKKTQSKQIAPRLYDLTTLQREANNKYSFPANKTLSIAQSLYEKHKMITYPRTDSRALPDDYRGVVVRTMESMAEPYRRFAQKAVDEGYVKKAGKRIFDSKQVSDHFALMPTDVSGKKLTDDEAKIYDMIARRFVAAFYPEAVFDVTTRISAVGSNIFKTEGKVLRSAGWLDVYNKETSDKEILPQLADEKERAKMLEAHLKEESTKPPARYTEATLLSAMEGAGKLLDDEELADAMKDKGLGTPATRAQIIENLIAHKLVERERRDLVPTARAESLIRFLDALAIDALTSPSMTGEWEQKLRLIERKQLSRKTFMDGICAMTAQIVDKARNFVEEEVESHEVDIPNPIDGSKLIETFRAYKSKDGKFIIYKTIGNRKISEEEVRELVTKGKVGPLEGFKSKMGRPYTATLKLDENFAVKFQFGDNPDGTERRHENLEDAPVVGKCPKSAMGLCKCKTGELVETETAYVCRCPKGEERKCSFRLGKTMLSHTITRAEIESLTNTGKTPVIEDFVSKRTKKKFSASLVLDARGSISFEFTKRTGKAEPKEQKK
ncbi:MAG: DNA topoisomerase 3 [Candidatus Merdousia sp.]|nr:DNA topoisomerase 3 [Candidatus Merdousia sp.]